MLSVLQVLRYREVRGSDSHLAGQRVKKGSEIKPNALSQVSSCTAGRADIFGPGIRGILMALGSILISQN